MVEGLINIMSTKKHAKKYIMDTRRSLVQTPKNEYTPLKYFLYKYIVKLYFKTNSVVMGVANHCSEKFDII